MLRMIRISKKSLKCRQLRKFYDVTKIEADAKEVEEIIEIRKKVKKEKKH